MNAGQQQYQAYGVHPALGPEPVAGQLLVGERALRFESAAGAVELPYQGLQIGFHPDDGRVFLSHPQQPAWTIYTPEVAVLSHRAFVCRPALQKQIARLVAGRWPWMKLVWVTVGFVVAFGVAWAGLSLLGGWLVDRLIARLPVAAEQKLGDALFEQVRTNLVLLSEPRWIEPVRAVGDRLRAAVPGRGLVFRFYVVRDADPTAFALPGGYIVVTSGLIELANTPDQLAGALAHELAHVTHRHALRRLLDSLGPWVLMRCAGGDDNRLLAAIADQSQLILQQAYSRAHEFEADNVACDYLEAAGLNPRGLIELLEKIQAVETRQRQLLAKLGAGAEPPPGLRSHPLTEERLRRLEARWQHLRQKQ